MTRRKPVGVDRLMLDIAPAIDLAEHRPLSVPDAHGFGAGARPSIQSGACRSICGD